MELTDVMLTEISYVEISTYRTKVMKSLDGDVKYQPVLLKILGLKQIIFQKCYLS